MFLSSQIVPALNGGAGGSSVRTQPNSQKSAWTSEAFWDTNGFCLFSKFQKSSLNIKMNLFQEAFKTIIKKQVKCIFLSCENRRTSGAHILDCF